MIAEDCTCVAFFSRWWQPRFSPSRPHWRPTVALTVSPCPPVSRASSRVPTARASGTTSMSGPIRATFSRAPEDTQAFEIVGQTLPADVYGQGRNGTIAGGLNAVLNGPCAGRMDHRGLDRGSHSLVPALRAEQRGRDGDGALPPAPPQCRCAAQSAGWKANGSAGSNAAETSPEKTRSMSTPRSSLTTSLPSEKSRLSRSTQNTLGETTDSR